MFIRRTKTRTTESGEQYYSYRLVDTYRVAERVRQRTLLNLGSGFTFPQEQWPELTQRIEQIVLGEHNALLPFAREVKREAQTIAALLLNKYADSNLLLSPGKGEAVSPILAQRACHNAHHHDNHGQACLNEVAALYSSQTD